MIRVCTAIAFIAALCLFESSAAADIGVAPDPRMPGVELDGTKRYPPKRGPGGPAKSGSSAPRDDGSSGDGKVQADDASFQQYDGLTWGDVRTAVRRLPFPVLTAKTQPSAETLVRIDTIFFVDASTYSRSVSLLGHTANVRAIPARFRWDHGDGSSQTTTNPGARHPNERITHRYRKAARNLTIRVDVTYEVEFRIDDGTWQDLGETITATGIEQRLTVRQATALLR